ncbi:MAG TPA: helix-turn-helix domain-containing protein, partial [Candidatus Nitrosotenuis sp.]
MLEKTRVKIDGRRTTREALTQEITSLFLGTSPRRPYPLSVTEIAKTLGISRETTYLYLKRAKDQIPRAKNGRICPPRSEDWEFRNFNKMHDITKDPLVSEWMDDLITRRSGNPIVTWK